jgi:hypothetical protein
VSDSPLKLTSTAEALRPRIAQCVREAFLALDAERASLDGKLAYSESEAAALLSLHPHQLRDERRRGRVEASVGPGMKLLYTRQDLLTYLSRRRWSQQM